MRYDSTDEKKETRRERNENFGKDSPEVDVPEQGAHLWEWFWILSGQRARGDGPQALRMADIESWNRMSGSMMRSDELDVLLAMDGAYREAQAVEESEQRERIKASQPSKTRRR